MHCVPPLRFYASTIMLFLTVFAVLLPMGYPKWENCEAHDFKVGNGSLLANKTREQLWNASVIYVFEDDPVAFYRGFLGTEEQFYAVCVLYWEWRNEPLHCGKAIWNGKSYSAENITQEEFKSFYEACSGTNLPTVDYKKRTFKHD